MSENIGITLLELQTRVKEKVDSTFQSYIWVRAEISSVKMNASGHCYLDLVGKQQGETNINSQARAIVWSSSWRVLRPYFENSTGRALEVGMSILFKAQVQYSELYGMSLIIYDIDPTYSVGEIERGRLEVIKRLKEEGMFDVNALLELPVLPRNFAVISSETAAGYRDFIIHLHENEYGYFFKTSLFAAPMQGNTAPSGIIAALDRIAELSFSGEQVFDAVLILRGGGSSTDLSCFDDYDLSVNIAQFPLPVMVAVGHDQDYHICDMVAYLSVKTPTALADYILDIFSSEEMRISSLATRLSLALKNKYNSANSKLDLFHNRVLSAAKGKISEQMKMLDALEQRVLKGNPVALLDVGYSIVLKGREKISSIDVISRGDNIEILLKDGVVECQVINVKKN